MFALAKPWNERPTLTKLQVKQIPPWGPFRQKDIDRLEKIQRSAARFVTQNYRQTASAKSLIQNLGWTDLKTRRENSRLVSMLKILNELVEIPINDRLIPTDRRPWWAQSGL